MPYANKEDKAAYMRRYRARKKAEKLVEKLAPGLRRHREMVETEKREGKPKPFEKPLTPPEELDPEVLDHVSDEEYDKGVGSVFDEIEAFDKDEEKPKPRPSNIPQIRKDLTDEEVQWLKDHPRVAEGRESGLLYDRSGKKTRTYTVDRDGQLKEKKREEDEKDLVWRF